MSVRGLPEAFEHAISVKLSSELVVYVPTIESLVCLKLFAWRDRHRAKPRHDSSDLADIFRRADDLVSLEVLYDDHADVMDQCDYDAHEACLQLIGTTLRANLTPEARAELVELLGDQTDETGDLALVGELAAVSKARVPGDRGLAWLRALARGLEGSAPESDDR